MNQDPRTAGEHGRENPANGRVLVAQITRSILAMLLLLLITPMRLFAHEAAQSISPNHVATLVLKDLTGHEQSINQYRGQMVVLNFWATWCIPCREEMPLLRSLQKRYGARGVQVIGASADDESTQSKVPVFVRRAKLNFPVWLGATTTDMQRFELGNALPATAIIDRDGQMVGRIIGPVDKADLENRIEWLLSNRQTPAPPALVNNIEKHSHEGHSHEHKGEEEHEHGGVGIEGASTVPS